jgi:hypothetical protein
MSTTEIVVLVVVVLVLLALAGYVLAQQRKRKALQSRFGPEYDRTVEGSGGRRQAERDLAERAERRQQLDIRPLSDADRRSYADRWRSTQEDFVDRPSLAVRQADVMVTEVMAKRGYPVGDFDQQARDLSVDHAQVVQEYRSAHDISDLNDREQATTEQLRQAMVHYRSLFTALVEDGGTADRHQDDRRDADRRDSFDADRRDSERYDADRREADRRDGAVLDSRDDAPRHSTSDAGYATDEDRRTTDRVDDRPSRTVVEGGLTRPTSDRTVSDTDRPGDVRPR